MTKTLSDNTNSISIYPILAVNFIGTLGFSIVLPFLVYLVDRWGGNALIFGLAGATYSAFQFVGAPILGRWSDTYGRRKILLLSQLGTLFSWILFIIAFFLPVDSYLNIDSKTWGVFSITLPLIFLFIARALDGATGGNVSVANAYLADISTEQNRTINFGKMSMTSNLGFVIGPALAGLLGATIYGEIVPVIVAMVISLIASIMIAFRLPESKPKLLKINPEEASARKVLSLDHKPCFELECSAEFTWRNVFKFRQLLLSLIINFLVMLGFSFFYTSFPMFAVQDLKWSVSSTGIFFSVLSIKMVLVQGPVLKAAMKKAGERMLVVLGSLILAIGFPLLASTSLYMIYSGVFCIALGNGLMWPSAVSLLSKSAGSKFQGKVQGVAGSLGAVASILGLISGGLLFDSLGNLVFFLSAIIILFVFIISLFLKTDTQVNKNKE